jgi:hypothetical protein
MLTKWLSRETVGKKRLIVGRKMRIRDTVPKQGAHKEISRAALLRAGGSRY